MRDKEMKVAVFTMPAGEGLFNELAARTNVEIAQVTDGLTKIGDVVRVVDYREKVKEPVYTPPC